MVSTGGALSSGAGRFLVEFSAVEGEAPVSLANLAVLYPAPHIPRGSLWSGRNPCGMEGNGRNLVGIRLNSNHIPSKIKWIIKTQIYTYSRSFQVIPGGIQAKKRMFFFSHIPGLFPLYSRSFQVHSSHIPGLFQVDSRLIPGWFPPFS